MRSPAPLERGPAVGEKPAEELGQLARDHRARVGVREVRPEGGAHARVELERLAVGGEPAGLGHGVLGQEADQLPDGALGREVARAPVAELGRARSRSARPPAARGELDASRRASRSRSRAARARPARAPPRAPCRAAVRRPCTGIDDRDRAHERLARARARRGPGSPPRGPAGRGRRCHSGVSLASSHSGLRKAVPQSGFATPWSPASPNSAAYQKPCSEERVAHLLELARASARPSR